MFYPRDSLSCILTFLLLHQVNSSNISACVVFTNVLGRNCPNNTVAGYKAFAAAGSSGSSKHSEQNRKPSGGICVLSAPRRETVVTCLPLLPRRQGVHTITINISRCGWSLSSFHSWNMVLNMVFCRGGSDGRMPKVFSRPVFLSVLQTAGSSSSSLSRVRASLPNVSVPAQRKGSSAPLCGFSWKGMLQSA